LSWGLSIIYKRKCGKKIIVKGHRVHSGKEIKCARYGKTAGGHREWAFADQRLLKGNDTQTRKRGKKRSS